MNHSPSRFVAVVGLVAALVAFPSPSAGAEDEPLLCGRFAVTVNMAAGEVPTEGKDVILGTEGDDIINGLGGDDRICGRGGDDIINDGPGRGFVNGGPGDDVITTDDTCEVTRNGTRNQAVKVLIGADGNDTITGYGRMSGSRGDDTIIWSFSDNSCSAPGPQDLTGGEGADQLEVRLTVEQRGQELRFAWILRGGPGDDQLQGGSVQFGDDGDDRLVGLFRDEDRPGSAFGGAGNDALVGGPGRDNLEGEAGRDRISGGGGDDILLGGAGNDVLRGGDGNDELDGGKGADRLRGGRGNDVLRGGPGNDRVVPGPGTDECYEVSELTNC